MLQSNWIAGERVGVGTVNSEWVVGVGSQGQVVPVKPRGLPARQGHAGCATLLCAAWQRW